MTNTVEARLRALNLDLPSPAAPAANYVPYLISGSQLFISGQLPMGREGLMFIGQVGVDLDIDQAQQAAQLCALNILSQAKAAIGDFAAIVQCLKLGGLVNAPPDFTDHPLVINGASNLIIDLLGDKGRHTRIAVGTSALPFGASVEVDALFAIA